MANIDKLLEDARALKKEKLPYQMVCVIEQEESGAYRVSGVEKQFDTEKQALSFCSKQAGGRRLVTIFADIPHVLPESDYIDTSGIDESAGLKELESYATANAHNYGCS